MSFEQGDVVRVRRLMHPTRDVDGSAAEPPQPRVGDRATVVDFVGDDLYLVEHYTDDGQALWLAEFHEEELELLEHPGIA